MCEAISLIQVVAMKTRLAQKQFQESDRTNNFVSLASELWTRHEQFDRMLIVPSDCAKFFGQDFVVWVC
jgi:hypothetical protein